MPIIKPNISVEEEYKSYPSYETIKSYIVMKIIDIASAKRKVTEIRFTGEKDYDVMMEFIAQLSELFDFLKPYLRRYGNSYLYSQRINMTADEFIKECDNAFLNPKAIIERDKSLRVFEAIFDLLNDFVFSRGITDVGAFFAGVKTKRRATREIDDIGDVRTSPSSGVRE